MKNIEDMLEVVTVGAGNKREYGRIIDGEVIYGFYLRAKRDSLLKKIENTAIGKFKLECDSENYVQEARRVYIEKERYYKSKYKEDGIEDDKNIEGYLFKACQREFIKIAQRTKGMSSQYDSASGEFLIANLLSIDATDKEGNYLHEGEVSLSAEAKKTETSNEFLSWFNANRDKILTKKQQQYLKGEVEIASNNRARMNKNICERVYRNYTKENIQKYQREIASQKIDIINEILTSKTDKQLMLRLIRAFTKNTWLLDTIYSLSAKTCRMVTKACKKREYICEEECINEIKEALETLKDFLGKTSLLK